MSEEESRNEAEPLPELSIIGMLRNNSSNIAGIFLCYVLGVMLGYLWPNVVSADYIAKIKEMLGAAQKEFQGNPLEQILATFGRTAITLYFAMIFGFLAGIPPVYLMLSEGIFQGVIAAREGHPWWQAFPTTVPDIIEFCATCITMSWGMKIGLSWFRPPRLLRLRTAFIECHRIFFRIALILLFIAAISQIATGK